ncbi:unnamed protein product [Auanema sp. JU1783]|nr:unnamed protein product [Auanema sp. JU1783]
MSNILAERGHVEIKEEEDNSRDSGFSSGRASPEPHNNDKYTNIRFDDGSKVAENDQMDMFCEFGFENTKLEERSYKTQLIHRIPLADCTNTSYSSQSSNRSFTTSRSMKQWIDSPLTTVCSQPEPRLLSFSMFDSTTDISFSERSQRFTVLDESSGQNDGCGTRSQPLRRTMSEHKDRSQRKRSIETRAEMENKRKKSSPSNVEDLDIDFDESVFTVDDDCSPNLSTWSLVSQQRSLPRATSCGVLEMGEHHSSPNLPKIIEVYSLPTVPKPQTDSQAFRSISAETLASELRKWGEKEFSERFTLVDCRYPYEYNGGHIKTAMNIHDQNELEAIFFPLDSSAPIRKRIPIFYCEYSQKRGPGMAHRLRSLDRSRNELQYPLVDYKEIYLLDHGYKSFFSEESHQLDLCEPSSYVAMREPQHSKQLTAYKWHKSKSSHHLDRQERATGGCDRFISRRRALFTRHLSMGTLNEVDTTPCTSRTRSMASETSLHESEGSSVAQRLNFEMDSPDNSCSE